jgi:hypothetical protein
MVDKQIAEKLRRISTFEQLQMFLSDEMDWPIRDFEIDELTFDYDPLELGIRPEKAAKVKIIKRMRPLSAHQPWGIFFVEFENKNLPVEALRRILSHVAFSKPGRGKNSSVAWNTDDVMFISNFGVDNDRQLSFAHFSKDPDTTSLPVLRVISWDSSDSVLHLDSVASNLQQNLKWPDEPSDVEFWRSRWSSAFTLKNKEVLTTARSLSKRLAELALDIRKKILSVLEIESNEGPITGILNDFRSAFDQSINAESFADMYAQTISYGLLASRISNPESKSVNDIAGQIQTSPLIGELVSTFLVAGGRNRSSKHLQIDFDELGINDVVELLNEANIEAVIRNFGDLRSSEDPVVHFYEDFLNDYDPVQRIDRGVFYTPRAVVRSIVEMTHEALKRDFDLEDGLADTSTWKEVLSRNEQIQLPDGVKDSDQFIKILDPAVGTGTFLVEVIDLVESVVKAKIRAGGANDHELIVKWNEYVSTYLLSRLNGFEFMMAPYVIAHLKISLKLFETGFRFNNDQRVGIYLTNALAPPHDNSSELQGIMPKLADEVLLVNKTKETDRFTIVLGNPPYSSVSQNNSSYISNELKQYLSDDKGEIKEKSNRNHLQDDYVKFIRLADITISNTGCGVFSMITNNSYLAGSWFRGMRYNLLQKFNCINVVNLHGGKGFVRNSGTDDQNVFEIMQSVAIGTFSLKSKCPEAPRYVDLIGSRELKYQQLSSVEVLREKSEALEPSAVNQWLFIPMDSSQIEIWEQGLSLENVFEEWGAAVKTNRNGLAVAFTREELTSQIQDFINLDIEDAAIEEKYSFSSNYQWKTGIVRRKLANEGFDASLITPYLFRPFDVRFIYWHPNIVFNMRGDKMEIFKSSEKNLGLMFSRTTIKDAYSNFLVTNLISDHDCLEKTKVAGLKILKNGLSQQDLLWVEEDVFSSNLTDEVVSRFAQLEIPQIEHDHLIFNYLYGLFQSEWYRTEFLDFLKIDFPRLLVPKKIETLHNLAQIGETLISLHCMSSDYLLDVPRRFEGTSDFVMGKARWLDRSIHIERLNEVIDNSNVSRFYDVDEDIWNYQVGGSKVCEKWLKDRRNRVVTQDEIEHFERILRAIELSIKEIKRLRAFLPPVEDLKALFS